MQREVLADAGGVDGDARCLADEVLLVGRNRDVAVDRLQDALAGDRGLAVERALERVSEVLRDVLQRPDVEVRRGVLDSVLEICCRDSAHALAFSAAALPARRPKTQHSRRELRIMRLRPWVPPAISPQA